ncbi:TRM13 [Bugula neritina]|uniref:tRNA:m(4)X modification enzyme TRM13 n=1 Tax=Bugula neritina TaxID=10212 RepID=A0A7J7K7Y0_BUGNE|nr:TRM13 [Bugula neritina]
MLALVYKHYVDTVYSFWTSDEREKIGLQCKRVIDAGRASYLRQLGYKATLVEFVGKAVSLENVMLVATPAGTQTISTPTTTTGNQQLAENELLV